MLASLAARAAHHALEVFGAFNPGPDDDLPDIGTLVLLGPREPGFWAHLKAQPEWLDGQPDPIDRWSARALRELAEPLEARIFLPFGGPPRHPFYRWALRSGRAWASPVQLLVHDRAGLMVSYRGALGLREKLELPAPSCAHPCAACPDKPCLTACPVGALNDHGYDLSECHALLDQPAGEGCMNLGCATRRACPLSAAYGRLPEQSAYHMRLFHP
ncbi:ferredoxin [Albidovulum inexpectatum]|uniref:ferredoxin n=1 Tax=Albidovulum inexpectatum TaxID=196587 RepID=UPI003CCBA9CC